MYRTSHRLAQAPNKNGSSGRSRRARSGVLAAELAILLPFLLVAFAAAVDFARIYYASQTLENCAYIGALYATSTTKSSALSTTPTNAAIAAACSEGSSLGTPLQSSNVTVSITGSTATVTVTYDQPLLTPVLTSSLTIHLTRTIVMNVAPTTGN